MGIGVAFEHFVCLLSGPILTTNFAPNSSLFFFFQQGVYNNFMKCKLLLYQ